MSDFLRALLLACALLPAMATAHEGDSEERAMHMLGLLQQLDRSWAQAARETDAGKRVEALAAHARAMQATQVALREAADKSACVMMEAQDRNRQLACLVDTEARLRATERLLGHVVNRLTLAQ